MWVFNFFSSSCLLPLLLFALFSASSFLFSLFPCSSSALCHFYGEQLAKAMGASARKRKGNTPCYIFRKLTPPNKKPKKYEITSLLSLSLSLSGGRRTGRTTPGSSLFCSAACSWSLLRSCSAVRSRSLRGGRRDDEEENRYIFVFFSWSFVFVSHFFITVQQKKSPFSVLSFPTNETVVCIECSVFPLSRSSLFFLFEHCTKTNRK